MGRFLACLFLVATMGCAAEEWQLRYTNFGVLSAEQKAGGAIPAFTVTTVTEDGEPVLKIDDDQKGDRIGQLYLGRELLLDDPRPKLLTVSFELQAACAAPDRTPSLKVMLLSRKGWERMFTDPATAGEPPRWQIGDVIAEEAVSYPEDTVTWLAWQSGNLARRLTVRTPRELVLVLFFGANHTGTKEFGRFRRVKVEMSNAVPPPPKRDREYPLKTARTLHSDDEVALARRRCDEDASARAHRERYIKASEMWLAVPDTDLTWRLPDASVPRAFNDSVAGCPEHGKAIFKHGTYPWLLEFNQPFKVICPIGKESYPSNDFLAWYQSGYQDKSALAGKISDDGWGWTPPGGERHWLVAYANHWFWSRWNIPGVLNLSRAYLLTGDRQYAHKCAAMLARIADIYPGMDYHNQSRYGTLSSHYPGKILNHIWETGVIQNLAEAYDNIHETIDGDTELQQFRGQSGEEIRSLIETNILEEGIRCILDGTIQGNFGMHQSALATLVAVRQTAPSDELLAAILDKTGAEGRYEGIRYALYNWIHRDGVPYETAPGYNFSWVGNLIETANIAEKAGIDLYAEPQFRRLMEWPIELIVNGRFTPAEGDSGDIRHGVVGQSADVYRHAFRHYGGPDFAWMLKRCGGAGGGFQTWEALFEEPVTEALTKELADHPRPASRSRVLDGYGMAILNNPAETVAVTDYYGWRGGHSHWDGLHFNLYAHGQAVMPDTGYPDFMNSFVPGIFSWSQTTVNHNTVVMDAGRQTGNSGGRVHHFAGEPMVQYVDASAPGNYPQASEYRRAQILVSTDEQNAYLVDIFRVAGGQQHDYSLHGTVGARTVVEGSFGPTQTKGTLAGENVEVGEFYDDPALAPKDYQGSYGGYRGSGFQHLINVQRQSRPGPVVLQIDAEADPRVKLRLHLLDAEGQQAILAEAQISPVKHPALLPYVLLRRQGDNLASTFVTVADPFVAEPQLKQVRRLATSADAVALEVVHAAGRDVILQAREGGRKRPAGDLLTSDAALVVARLAADGSLVQAMAVDGSSLSVDGTDYALKPVLTGTVAAVDPRANTVTVKWAGAPPADWPGRTVTLGNDARDNLYSVTAAEDTADGTRLTLSASLLNGRGRVTATDDQAGTLTTDSRMLFQTTYGGRYALNEAQDTWLPITSAGGGTFTLRGAKPSAVFGDPDGDDKKEFWVCTVAPGDQVRTGGVTVLKP